MSRTAITLVVSAAASIACAHGVPIELSVSDGSLRVSHASNAYAPFVFGQFEEDDVEPQGPANLPGLGPMLRWGFPGIDINGMADGASLALEPLARDEGAVTRPIWYWNPTTRRVEAPPSGAELTLLRDATLLLDGTQHAAIPAETSSPPIALADSVTGETGYHNHTLANYAMSASPLPPGGLYALRARFTSDQYAPSEPFLVLLGLTVPVEDLVPASEAIWLAANPGDYTLDGVVDTADYDTWATNYGSTPALAQTGGDGNGDGVVNAADYTLWRDHLSVGAVSVPEAAAIASAVVLSLSVSITRRR